jgi:Cdc6-like AAA superfamily ATPase
MILDSRIDRESELAACVQHLGYHSENMFLWGARGVGKTFLVRLVHAELEAKDDILCASVDMLGLPGFGRHDPATAFPEAVLLALCTSIWKNIVGKPYSELRGRLELSEGSIRLSTKIEKVVESIYKQVMISQRKSRYEYSNSVGFSAAAKGEKKEIGWVEQEQPPVLPFEFLEYCEELLHALLKVGKRRIVALCDEANRLPFEKQEEILGRYVDLFASRNVQFLFVAGVHRFESTPPPIPEGFDQVLHLQGLGKDATLELLQRISQQLGVKLEPESAELVLRALWRES